MHADDERRDIQKRESRTDQHRRAGYPLQLAARSFLPPRRSNRRHYQHQQQSRQGYIPAVNRKNINQNVADQNQLNNSAKRRDDEILDEPVYGFVFLMLQTSNKSGESEPRSFGVTS